MSLLDLADDLGISLDVIQAAHDANTALNAPASLEVARRSLSQLESAELMNLSRRIA